MSRTLGLVMIGAGLVGGGGCIPRPTPSVADPDPMIKIPAMKRAVAARDLTKVKLLVAELDSDDPAVRLYAIQALQHLSGGERYGYDYFAPDDLRAVAVARWQAWLSGDGGARASSLSTAPATQPATARSAE